MTGRGWILSGYLTVYGSEEAQGYLRSFCDAGLQKGVPGGVKEDRKRLMEQEGITRKKGLEQIRDFHKGAEGVKENPPVQGQAPTDPVEGAFRDIKVAAQGRDRGKLPGGPGIEEMDEKAQAVRRVRDDEGKDEGMGRPAGSTQEGGEGYHAVTDAVVHVRDKVAVMGTIMGIRRGRSTAVWAGRQFREVRFKHNRQDLIIIKMFDVVKSHADVQVKSYHNGESYIGPWLFMAQSLREGVQA